MKQSKNADVSFDGRCVGIFLKICVSLLIAVPAIGCGTIAGLFVVSILYVCWNYSFFSYLGIPLNIELLVERVCFAIVFVYFAIDIFIIIAKDFYVVIDNDMRKIFRK